ncbi:GFA family protein [Janthinobacterium sp. 17J80-10]|nr:GFA family protein [Janthinobacterium sp. 17J80-10]
MNLYTGSCLCGGVQFSIAAEFEPIQICHCGQCRKAQGTPIATNSPVLSSAFHMTTGQELITEFESSPGKKRCFCKVCGSPIYSYRESLPGVFRIRVGLINEPILAQPEAHFHTGSKCNWWRIDDDLPQYIDSFSPAKDEKESLVTQPGKTP